MSVHLHTTKLPPTPASHQTCGRLVLDMKRCLDDCHKIFEQSTPCRPGAGYSGGLSLPAHLQPHQAYALVLQMVFSIHGYVLHDAGEGPTHPRNTRNVVALPWARSRSPARNISDRPSSSRSTGSSYYPRPSAGSGNWTAPRPPTRLPEPQCVSLHPPTGYLHNNPGMISAERETKTYYLEIVQQPEVSAEFGSAALSRLPLAPPLVAQLIIRDNRGHVIESDPEHPYLICHLSLHSADGTTALDPISPSNTHFPPDRLLYGNLVSSPHYLRNLEGRSGVYFLFPDVSVRLQGRYVLQLTLMRLSRVDASGMVRVGESGSVLAQARTRPFDVRPRHAYVAPQQTPLTEFFYQQGARIMRSNHRTGDDR